MYKNALSFNTGKIDPGFGTGSVPKSNEDLSFHKILFKSINNPDPDLSQSQNLTQDQTPS